MRICLLCANHTPRLLVCQSHPVAGGVTPPPAARHAYISRRTRPLVSPVSKRKRRREDSLLVCARRLLLFGAVLVVAGFADFSSGLVFAAIPLIGRIRPALHARRPRGRGDVQPVLVVARRAQFSSRIFAVYPLTTGRIRPALHARRPRGHSNVPRLRRIWNSNDVSRDETACDGSHHAYECR